MGAKQSGDAHQVSKGLFQWKSAFCSAEAVPGSPPSHCVQLKLAAAAAGGPRDKLPTYSAVPASEANGHAPNGRHDVNGGATRVSPRSTSLSKITAQA